MSRSRRVCFGVICSLLVSPLVPSRGGAGAQSCAPPSCASEIPGRPRLHLRGELLTLGVNATLGALTAELGRKMQGASGWGGLWRGAVGGAAVYAGKRLSGERKFGDGLLGRHISAIGSSIIANASADRRAFESLVVPVWLGRIHVDRGGDDTVSFKLDVIATAVSLYFAAQGHTSWDPARSLSSGAPVFVSSVQSRSAGTQTAGVLRLRRDTRETMAFALAHEQVHVAQTDFTLRVWGEPAERKVLSGSRLGRRLQRHFDFRLDEAGIGILGAFIPYRERPWEQEAHFLSRTGQGISQLR